MALLGDFRKGFGAPFGAAGFLFAHKRLLQYVLIPFLINVGVFAGTGWFGFFVFDRIVDHYLPAGNAWYWVFLAWFLWLVAIIVVLILVFFTFTVVGNLIASPFNDLLSERTEEVLAGRPEDRPFSAAVFLRDAARTLREESKRMGLFLLGMVLLLFLHLLPGLGQLLYPPLSLGFTVFFLAVEYTGYVFARKGATFRDQQDFIRSHKAMMFGFGLGVFCLLVVPFVQFFCIPLGVVGATRLWYEAGGSVASREPSRPGG